ncbi:mechanosensitive ion channel protein MscS, partial [Acinetobacter baumannii]|nr:mechanosensitive ion channel protein MscS [Acinetobacter baumannii]
YNRSWLVLSAIKAVGGLLGLAALWYGAYRSWRRVKHLFRRRIIENRSWIPQSWRRFIGAIEARLYATLMILLGVIALYVWLSWVLSLFPWTRVWGASLGDWSVRVFQGIALAVV